MSIVLLVLLFLGLIPNTAVMFDQTKGPDARLGMAYYSVFVLAPWWTLAAILTAVVYARGAFSEIAVAWPLRLLLVASIFGLACVSFFVRLANTGMPHPMDVVTCVIMPGALVLYLAWLIFPGWTNVPRTFAHLLALAAICLPVAANVVPLAVEGVRTSPQWVPELRQAMEKRRQEARRKEEDSNLELKALRAELAALPLDCPIEKHIDLFVGRKPEVFSQEVLNTIMKRPTLDTDLIPLLEKHDSTGAFLLAYHHPKPTSVVAPALAKYLEASAAEFPNYKGAYPQVFAHSSTGFETALLAARRVQAVGGSLSAPLELWRKNLEDLPDSPTRSSLLRQVKDLQKQRK